ncbi:MAG: winged helix-turn-helix transcriptional regulator [Ktedonobacteraceae bacterium]|nr:winged helix-turn-helix transcriptional regulator [Ktedonobacteraceae bacterium]
MTDGSSKQELLPEDVPVEMPRLPARLVVNSVEQFKAIGDPVRNRILAIIQSRPATAKQLAGILRLSPGTVGHHLQVLEEAGLAKVVARRLVHGIVAKYYTRTARVFVFDVPHDVKKDTHVCFDMLTEARDQLVESLEAYPQQEICTGSSFPRMRLSPERARAYAERVRALVDDFVNEEPDPDGQVYSLCTAFFKAPPSLQGDEIAEAE